MLNSPGVGVRAGAAGWHAVAERAARQHGVVSRAQLARAGLGDRAIERALRNGHLHRAFRGVYGVGFPAAEGRARTMAAALAAGEGAVISHLSAAALLGLVSTAPVVVDVIAPARWGLKVDGIRPHRVSWRLRRDEVGAIDGIPCTGPNRTLADLAGMVGERTLRSAFERAAARKALDVAVVEAAGRNRRGAPTLRALCERWRAAAPLAGRSKLKSPLEAKVLPLLTGLPAPRANAPVRVPSRWIEVDFLWERERFVLEADSREFHGTEAAFERDRWRDRELMRAGYASLRVTRLAAETEAAEIADAIAAHLRGR